MFRLVLQNNKTGTNVTSFIQNHLKPIQMCISLILCQYLLISLSLFSVAKWQQLISLFRAQNSFVPKDMLTKTSYRPHFIPSQKTFVHISLAFSVSCHPLLFSVSERRSDRNTDVMDLCSAFGHAE